jgi:hypothetical protein
MSDLERSFFKPQGPVSALLSQPLFSEAVGQKGMSGMEQNVGPRCSFRAGHLGRSINTLTDYTLSF